MASVDGDVHKSLWESMKAVTRRRLEFDHKMRERATNSVGPPGMSAFSPDVGGGGALASNAVDSVHNDNWQKSDGILSIEGRVTYIKFQADQLLHLAEVSRLTCGTNEYRSWFSPDACDDSGLASRALKAYTSALRAASGGDQTRNNQHSSDDNCGDNAAGNALKNKGSEDTDAASVVPTLPELHPLRLELVWRTSFILFHFLDRPLEAWEAAYPTYVAAAERPARLGPRALIIAQLLRDHLATIEIQCGEGERLQNWGEGCGLDDRGGRRSSSHDEGWSFLRMATTSESEDELPGMGGDAKSRVIAQVLHARACMEGVAKVLLGTMAGADRVFSALERIFSAYVKGHSVLPTKYEQGGGDDNSNNDNCNTNHNNSNTVWCQGRPVTLKLFLSQGPYLAWSGFEALCNDFKVAKTTSRTTSSRLIGAAAQENHPDHSRPFETPTQPDREQNAIAAAAAESFLLTEVEARVAFLCACTHKSVVASFPDTDGKAVVAAAAGAGVEGVADNRTNHGNEERYWKDMGARMVEVPASSTAMMPQGTGLNFVQFVDALARCGLIGFSSRRPSCCGSNMPGAGATRSAVASKQDSSASAPKCVQAIFTIHMKLPDSKFVSSIVRRQMAAVQAQRGTAAITAVNSVERLSRQFGSSRGINDVRGTGAARGTTKARKEARTSTTG